jgi:DMSO reductase anchor subunit/ferredoxin
MQGCPVDAYEKDPLTGIVSHLDDQCIGCSYCTLTCPYEVPSYDHRRGIVRKCDMCAGRLEAGEAPACVQGCPNAAISITVVDVAAAVTAGATGALVPGAPPSSITSPTTQYRSARPPASRIIEPAASLARPARRHPQLTVMLVLTQLAVGTFVVDLLLRWLTTRGLEGAPTFDALVAITAGIVALAASVFHLGRPWHCYRAVIGLRHSWLSREVVAFGAFTALAVPYALVLAIVPDALGPTSTKVLGATVAVTGIAGVACSVLIYTRTRRTSWRPATVTAKFALTATVCGIAVVLWASTVSSGLGVGAPDGLAPGRVDALLLVLAALVVVKLAGEASVLGTFRWRTGADDPERARRARLLTGELRPVAARRLVLGALGGVVLPFILAVTAPGGSWVSTALMTVALATLVAGELIERTLFFTTASPPR